GPPGGFEGIEAGPHEIGQMLYTSGSTGRPKGVPLSHAGQLWALSRRTAVSRSDERTIVAQPLFHMNGLFATKTVFANNASMVMMPAFEARPYTAALAKYRVTAIAAIPTMLARVIKEIDLLGALEFSALERITLGSAPMTLG